MTQDRNGTGPFRLNGGVEAPAPPPETGSLPLYPPIAESTLGKVNIVIFSGNFIPLEKKERECKIFFFLKIK